MSIQNLRIDPFTDNYNMVNMDHYKQLSRRPGFTLVECILAGAVIVIVMSAAMAFRSYAVAGARQAENRLLAAQCAYLLSETWRAQEDITSFNPLEHNFDAEARIEKAVIPLSLPHGSYADMMNSGPLQTLGSYRIQIDNKDFYAQLLYGSVSGTDNLESIHVYMIWQDRRETLRDYYLPTLVEN